ncbi:hypothetical protein ABFV47_25030 [Mycolicibacterium fortuitum]|uniref:hypothetical protein n=1 Tax=Mycolicibacterium fortuitum TaxID=1766 RepID=UPI003A87B00F
MPGFVGAIVNTDCVESDNTKYWSATDQVVDLARDIILRPDAVEAAKVDSLLDFGPGLLIRVVDNIATAAFLQIAEHLGLNLNDHRVLGVLLHPLNTFEVVPAAQASIDDTVKGIYWGVKEFIAGRYPTDDAVVPLYIEHSAAPSANVINGAMPVIVALLQKNTVFEEPSPLLGPEAQTSVIDAAVSWVVRRLEKRIPRVA